MSLHHSSEESFSILFEGSPIGMTIQDLDGRFVRVNESMGRLLGRTTEEILEANYKDLTYPEDVSVGAGWHARAVLGLEQSFQCEKRYLHAAGHTVRAMVNISVLRDDAGRPQAFLSQVKELADQRSVEEQLIIASLHDALTGLPNRRLFSERLDLALSTDARTARHSAVLFVGLDDFKTINEGLGHAAGDELLRLVAERLRSTLREVDTLARLGGDEFAVLMEGVPGIDPALQVGERMLRALQEPFDLFGRETTANVSIGIALSDAREQGADVLRKADLAMRAAKLGGKRRLEIFDSSMHDEALRRLDTRAELHRAVERGEFVVHYQPIFNLRTKRIAGVEALVRWQHPERGLIGPSDFIPLAEQLGLIIPIDLWILNQACRQAATWHEWHRGEPQVRVTVNMSASHFTEPGLVDDVRFALDQSGLEPGALILEVTESVFLHDSTETIETLKSIKDMGVSLAIDDFGTGYASLSYLRRFPVDILKIDKIFIDSIANGPEDAALAHAVIRLGRTLGMQVVAEGVERTEQVAKLTTQGCELAQGFFFAHPGDTAAINILLTDENETLGVSTV